MGWKDILQDIGDKTTEFSMSAINFISEKFGIEASSLSTKLITILFLGLIAYFSLKITQKVLKIGLIVIASVLIVSLVFSM